MLKYYWIYTNARDNKCLSHTDALKEVKAAAVNNGLSETKASEMAENASRAYQGLNISTIRRDEA